MSNRSGVLPLSAVVFLLAGCVGEPGGDQPPTDDPTISDAINYSALRRERIPPYLRPGHPHYQGDAGTPTDPPPPPPDPDSGVSTPSDAGTEPPPPPPPPPPADAGTDAGTSEPPPPPPPGDPLSALGPLPTAMAGLRWPDQPRITREVTVTTAADLAREAGVSGTRIHVNGAVGGGVSINTNDIEIIADSRTSLGQLSVGRSVSRVRVSGGTWTGISTAIPAVFYPSVEYRPEWMASDVTIEGVTVRSSNSAFEIRGRRIAIARSRASAVNYSVWCGDTASFASEDIILHDNVFESDGPQATVRLVQVLRSATISNVLVNGAKHNYRVHGTSDLNYAADNLLVNTGTMLGTMPGDDLGRIWFDDNVFHHTAPDLFNPGSDIDALHATGNTAYTNVWSCFYCRGVSPGWTVSSNTIAPYTPPPPY